jgi:hypothetical protein
MVRGRSGTGVGTRVAIVGVDGIGVTVAVGVDPPQAAKKIGPINRLKIAKINWRKDILFLPETGFMQTIIQQTVYADKIR